MKTPPSNTQQPKGHENGRVDSSTIKRSGTSRHFPRLVIGLVILLLLDIGFILVESSASHGTAASEPPHVVIQIAQASPTVASTPTMRPTLVATPTPTRAAVRSTSTPKPLPANTSTPKVVATATTEVIAATTVTATETVTASVDVSAVVTASATLSQSGPAPATATCDSPVGQLITDSIQSKVLGQALPVHVYLPPCYDGSRYSYPALYLIQGSGYNFGEWVDDGATRVADQQMGQGLLPPFIIVMPANDLNAGNGSRYLYSTGGKGSWEDFILNELAPLIETKYSAWTTREGRAIGGISRGGYWSLEIGFSHPDLFTAIGGHSPSITSDQLIGVPANFSMLSFVRSLDTLKATRISLDAGSNDWAQNGVAQLSNDLEAKGITYTVSSGDGIHSDAYWTTRMPDYLAFYSANWPRTARSKAGSPSADIDNQKGQP